MLSISKKANTIQDEVSDFESEELSDESDEMTDQDLIEMLAGKHRLQDDGKILHVAIIDYLTRYTYIKRVEKWGKAIMHPIDTVSVQHPDFYGDRFSNFMTRRVFGNLI